MNEVRRFIGFSVVSLGLGTLVVACANTRPNFESSSRPRADATTEHGAGESGVGAEASVAPAGGVSPGSTQNTGSIQTSQGSLKPAPSVAVTSAPPPPGCGDGVRSPETEQCDNGAANSDVLPSACRTNCTTWRCGDGVIDNGETCDDGPANGDLAGAVCRTNCTPAGCGDGVTDATLGELCDDGAQNSDDVANACRVDCTRPSCGDGVRDVGEACDNGEANADGEDSECNTKCLTPNCGNGKQDPAEECDDGAGNSDTKAGACRTSCQNAGCGDGITDPDEACDHGDENSDSEPDACRADCSEPRCGDQVKDGDEECDGEENCTPDCALADCGNHVVEAGEQCDGEDDCRDDCVKADCGNDMKEGTEECDGEDDCTDTCTKIVCGDRKIEGDEACDEGSNNSEQGSCTPQCVKTFCGDGVVQTTEQCDDGKNTTTYYGCGAGCKWAPSCGDGSVQPDHEECDGGNECDECKKLPSKLEPGGRLYPGDVLAKSNMRLQVTDGGDVQLLNNGGQVWNTNTSGSNPYITFQGDGNLVVYAGGEAVWSSATRNGEALVLDGSKLFIQDGTNTIKQLYPVVAETDQLEVNQRMYSGTKLVSGNTTLSILGDGNLVVKVDGSGVWSARTNPNTGAFAVLQGDGNFVVRSETSETLWESDTRNATKVKLTADSLQILNGSELVKELWAAE